MSRHIHRITAVTVIPPHGLRIVFDDGAVRTVNLTAMLRGPIYGALLDPAVFALVSIDPECGTVVWPSGADMDPGTLHDWAEEGPRMAALAAHW